MKFWITLNEPYIVANLGYGYGTFAPGNLVELLPLTGAKSVGFV